MSFARDESCQAGCWTFLNFADIYIYSKYGGVYRLLLLEHAPTGLRMFKKEFYLSADKDHRRTHTHVESGERILM